MQAQSRQRGITLIELITVMLVIGILAAIAFPSYRQYAMKANRTDAKVALTNFAQQLERCFTLNQTYAGCLQGLPQSTQSNDYQVSVAVDVTGQLYTLTATALGAQASDTQCPAFTLNQANVRTPAANTSCW